MTIIRVLTIFRIVSWVIFYPIGCGHPLMRILQRLLAKMIVTRSLLHSLHNHQPSVNSLTSSIFCNQGITWMLAVIPELLAAMIGIIQYIKGKPWIPNLLILQAVQRAKKYYWLMKT
jgi:hypothetical protein